MSQENQLVVLLEERFEKYQEYYPTLSWEIIQKKLTQSPEVLKSLSKMEETGGEPAVVGLTEEKNGVLFYDCSTESPSGRRSLCYDEVALNARKKHKPESSAEQIALDMGITLLNESDYAYLQTLGDFDNKTSSWLFTPTAVRERGGSLFGDKRYGRVFVYHNGADSYYAGRGFRGKIVLPLEE